VIRAVCIRLQPATREQQQTVQVAVAVACMVSNLGTAQQPHSEGTHRFPCDCTSRICAHRQSCANCALCSQFQAREFCYGSMLGACCFRVDVLPGSGYVPTVLKVLGIGNVWVRRMNIYCCEADFILGVYASYPCTALLVRCMHACTHCAACARATICNCGHVNRSLHAGCTSNTCH
jgi:hypothetical protein